MNIIQEHELSCDILVAGGGPAGVPAALAAARNGAKVILCQDRSVLGGNASSEVRMHIVGADNGGKRGTPLETEIREGGIMEEIRLETAVRNPQRSASMLDLILYELCRAEKNLTLMLNTRVVDAEVADGLITHAIAERHSTEDRFRIAAKVFMDCTGDGQLGVAAGAPFHHGREGADEYGEDMAVPESDGKTLGSTLLFQARDMGRPMPFKAPPWARKFSEEDLRFRPHGEAGVDRGLEYGYWWAEWGGELDTIKDNETIRDELLAIILGVWDHIKNDGDHGAENWALDWFSFLPGKRESRRFIGQYVLRQSDLTTSRKLDDAIAYGGWSIDTHPPEGIDAPHLKPCNQPLTDYVFDIPLRSCVANEPGNLLFAGRNISASHIAFASTRVMATCAVIGQGAGTAAAYAVAHDRLPSELADDDAAVKAIQQRLLRDDAYLIGHINEDEHDLARSAQVFASSEQVAGCAANVISGQSRAVHGELGAPPDRANPGTHRWMSDPSVGLPAWIELRWPQPVSVKEVQIIFDSGLSRVLTLSHSDGYVERMEWGQAQSETVSDYVIEGCVEGEWKPLVTEAGNYQRRRVHALEEEQMLDALRVSVAETNGLDHARICEIRAYGSDAEVWV